MSPIDDLIAELCPNGVEHAALGSLVSRPATIKWSDRSDGEEFQYIDLTSVDRRTHAIGDTVTITRADAPSRAQQIVEAGDVIFGTTRPMLRRYARIPDEYAGQICSTGFCVLRPDPSRLLSSYLFHAMGAPSFYGYVEVNQRGASYPAIPDQVVKKFRLPIPPLEIQHEIAVILDKMERLEAELEAELTARRRQYRYYRDELFTFHEHGGVRWLPMGEVGEFIRGRRFTKEDVVPDGLAAIHYGEIYTRYGTATTTTVSYVTTDLEQTLRFAHPGDVVIAAVGETVEDVGKAVAWLGETDAAVHDDCFIFRQPLNAKFVAYYFQTAAFHAEKAKHVARAKVKRLSGESLGKLTIPVPSAAQQQRVVSILDKFDALVSDLSVGLPAELSARRQQYEYYRDRLLTFEEAA